jgi:hypothetical protein
MLFVIDEFTTQAAAIGSSVRFNSMGAYKVDDGPDDCNP